VCSLQIRHGDDFSILNNGLNIYFIPEYQMPNNCWNYLTITGEEEELKNIIKEEFKSLPSNHFNILQRGQEALKCKLWSAWHPNFEWLESLLEKYPSIWVKDIWTVEDGEAGAWIGTARSGKKEIRQLTWEDMSIEEEMYRFR